MMAREIWDPDHGLNASPVVLLLAVVDRLLVSVVQILAPGVRPLALGVPFLALAV